MDTSAQGDEMELLDHERRHLMALRPYLSECTVLLRSSGAFPLERPCTVALHGNGARRTIKGGTGSGEVNSRFFVNIEEGLEQAGFEIASKSWLDEYDRIRQEAKNAFVKKVKAEARAHHQLAITYAMGMAMVEPDYSIPLVYDADVAIYVLSRDSGEGNDRKPIKGDVLLTDSERRDILDLNSRFKHFMLVLNVGGPVDLGGLENVKDILLLSQLGVETGCALADILLGRTNPSGKLATTWAAWKDHPTIGTFGDRNDADYREGIYVGYRYFDASSVKPLFPFGYGLSYTTFRTEPKLVEINGSTVTVQVDVTNTGKRSGKEVIQVYISCPYGKLDKCRKDLAGFAKTSLLAPGCTETVSISFRLEELASYDSIDSSYILEKGDYIVRIGTRSDMTLPIAIVRLDENATVSRTKRCCGEPSFEDWSPEPEKEEIPDYLPVLEVKASDIETVEVSYNADYPIDDAVKKLDDRQLCLSNIGTFNEKGGILSVIGDASSEVAGAAGQVSTALNGAGFRTMVLADGPAGLRLVPHYYRDEKGAHRLGHASHSESFMQFMPKIVKWLMKITSGSSKPPKGAEVRTQYCTAIPIGTAIAQSWNVEFAKLCGDIVGTEMQLFGVHLWLAPALNIHRSILCGRNFEYYSEDPLISGLMAAYMTIGVQSHEGCGTTIKHYAANNQETNRYGCSSNVSERAMREIYLKGFGICVRLSQPKAVMTSYNLLNGKHTAERADLIEDILRCEFGFKGIVMTDWVVGDGLMNGPNDKYPKVKPQLTAAAGSDLFMPGCKKDLENMLKGLADGSVSREQMQVNATRVYRMGNLLNGEKA